MSETAWIIVGIAIASAAVRLSGPLLLGHRELPSWTGPVLTVLPGAIFTGLIVVQVLGPRDEISIDERLAGLAVAGIVLWWRRSAVFPALAAGAATVALIRLLL